MPVEQSLAKPTRPDQTWFMKNIQEAKTHLSRLVEQAAAGEEIIIAKSGKPMARLVAYQPPQPARSGGFLAGKIWESGDCWESDDEIIEAMTGAPIEPTGGISKVAETGATYRTGK
jgi:prevent-host-death family protein